MKKIEDLSGCRKIAVYGSLKKGFWNHDRFSLGEPIATSKIRGSMFDCGYPHLYREGICPRRQEREHVVEIYEVDDDKYGVIRSMELGAGYQEVLMNLDGHEVVVFYTRDDHTFRDNWVAAYD